MVYYFNKGGPIMWPLLALLCIGVIFIIVKLWVFARSQINVRKFLDEILENVKAGKIDEAVKICENTRGPVSAVFHSGLTRIDKGITVMERAMENTAAIEISFLEKGMVWLSTIISVAPMLGFLGTVQGMIIAFERVAKSNDIIPSEVAGGISTALLTTFSGLAIAIPMQIFYNWFVSITDSTVVNMEDASNTLVETLLEQKLITKEEE